MERDTEIHHYWHVIRRRKSPMIWSAVIVFLVTAVVAFVLPPVYRSTATILIEAQEIPQDLVRSTVTGYVEERLQSITQLVLIRSRLLDIIGRFGLYEDLKNRYTTEEIIQKMREDIQLEPIQTQVINPKSGRPGSATIAFTLSYEGEHAKKVTQVANVLTSLYMEENLKNREAKARTTFEFLENQLKELRAETLRIEAEIAGFKNEHIQELPELMELNLRTMERLQREIDVKRDEIKTLVNRKIYLEGQLATVEPMMYAVTAGGKRVMTPREELELLRSQYLSLKATHAEGHPDVVALKKRLDVMEEEVSGRDELRKLYAELHDKQAELARLSEKFSDKHPDMIRLTKEVAEIKKEVDVLAESQNVLKAVEDEQPENPSYIHLKTQIASAEMQIENANDGLALLQAEYKKYQTRVENTPQVEQQYRALQRDYVNAQAKYQETLNRLLAAKEAKGLEESRMGEKFTLIDPAVMPEKPDRPNRLAIVLIGFILAMGAGIGSAALAEYADQSVRDADELTKISGHPVLAVIPYLDTPSDLSRKRLKRWVYAGSAAGFVIIGLALLHYVWGPLDVLWVRAVRYFYMSF